MSNTGIAAARVVSVLLADGWHPIVRGSFSVGPLGFGTGADPGVLGFRFEEADTASPYGPATLAGPLSSVLAVRQVGSAVRHPGELARPASSRWVRSASEAAA
jgi:hypothetical protein